jgi:hypothetical protein
MQRCGLRETAGRSIGSLVKKSRRSREGPCFRRGELPILRAASLRVKKPRFQPEEADVRSAGVHAFASQKASIPAGGSEASAAQDGSETQRTSPAPLSLAPPVLSSLSLSRHGARIHSSPDPAVPEAVAPPPKPLPHPIRPLPRCLRPPS